MIVRCDMADALSQQEMPSAHPPASCVRCCYRPSGRPRVHVSAKVAACLVLLLVAVVCTCDGKDPGTRDPGRIWHGLPSRKNSSARCPSMISRCHMATRCEVHLLPAGARLAVTICNSSKLTAWRSAGVAMHVQASQLLRGKRDE
jgi:hypothetical protein